MRIKGRVGVALCLLAVGSTAVGATLLLSSQSAGTRRLHLETTAAGIRQGNYYAWGQVWMWLERLTPEEKKYLFAACAQYASSNIVLHVRGCEWPPDHSAGGSPMALVIIRDVAGMKDDALVYDNLLHPPMEVMVGRFEPMYTASPNDPP